MTIHRYDFGSMIEINATADEIAHAKRMYSVGEAETTIGAHGRYNSVYKLARVADSHFIVKFTNPRGHGVWGGRDDGEWGDVYLEKATA